MLDKLQEIGIPAHEITPSVSIAVNGLFDHIEHLNSSLQQTKHHLESIQQMVDVDPVSVVANRRALIKRLNWSIAMGKRYSGPTSIVTFAINDLKSISSTYGYQTGERLSAYVAEYIAGHIRDTDYFARINESQFGVIMYFAESDDVVVKSERLCSEMRQSPFRWNNSPININLIYGVHAITASDDPESALLSSINALFVNESKHKFEQINFKA